MKSAKTRETTCRKRDGTSVPAAATQRAGRRGRVKARSGLAGRSRRAKIPALAPKKVLKSAVGRTRALFDVETGRRAAYLLGHIRHIRSVCRRGWRGPPRRPVIAHCALPSRDSLCTSAHVRVLLMFPELPYVDILNLHYKKTNCYVKSTRKFLVVDISRISVLSILANRAKAEVSGETRNRRFFRFQRSIVYYA